MEKLRDKCVQFRANIEDLVKNLLKTDDIGVGGALFVALAVVFWEGGNVLGHWVKGRGVS